MICAVASAADSVIVTMKPVAANPSRQSDQRLAAPPREQLFEHRDTALSVRAQLRHAPVHRERAEERQQHQDQRRQRREHAGRQERDAGLISERREVVHAGEAHDLPPGGLVDLRRRRMRALRLLNPLEEPLGKTPLPVRCCTVRHRRQISPRPAAVASSATLVSTPSPPAWLTFRSELGPGTRGESGDDALQVIDSILDRTIADPACHEVNDSR